MHSKAIENVVSTILKYSWSERDALEIVAALSQVNWKAHLTKFIECETCGYIYDICKKPSTWICPRCDPHKIRECEKLLYAQRNELKSQDTLTIDVWAKILDYFDWKCAYCLERQYVELDHFIPRSRNGLTTVNNCIPACRPCNLKKHNAAPEDVKYLPREAVERVSRFLESL